jgi:hypothetical protein
MAPIDLEGALADAISPASSAWQVSCVGYEVGDADTNTCNVTWTSRPGSYLAGCTSDGCSAHGSFTAAQAACVALSGACGGVLEHPTLGWQTRAQNTPRDSPNAENSWVKGTSNGGGPAHGTVVPF